LRGKDFLGLDESQVRLYPAIARHTVLVMAALAICAVTAAQLRQRTDTQAPAPVHPGQAPPADTGMIALTAAEFARLLARVITAGQLLDRQQHALAEAGCLRIFADKLSGKNADRPELAACLDYPRPGDTLRPERMMASSLVQRSSLDSYLGCGSIG
jgi:hypothetical protein